MSDSNTTIRGYINTVRNRLAESECLTGVIRIIGISIPFFFILLWIESVFYLDIVYRRKIMAIFWILTCTGFGYHILRFLINRNQWFGNRDDEYIARYIGARSTVIADRILNTLQIENRKLIGSNDSSLIDHAVNRMKSKLETITPESIIKAISRKLIQTTVGITVLCLILTVIFRNSLLSSGQRLLNPLTEFSVPMPFTLVSMSGNQSILGGDTVTVSITGVGELPDSVELNWESISTKKEKNISAVNEVFTAIFPDVNADLVVWAEVHNTSWFSPWNTILSEKDTIFVTDRPVIEDIQFTIVPPVYTEEEPFTHPGNITDIHTLKGSRANVAATASKSLSKSWIVMNGARSEFAIRDNQITGDFTVLEDLEVSFWCIDQNLVANIHPPQYRFSVIPDTPPEIIVFAPEREFDLDENMAVEFNVQVTDDYGFTDAAIEFRIVHPDYLQKDTTIYNHPLTSLLQRVKSQQLYYNWEIEYLNLGPEDELHFHILVRDNNTLTGPSVSRSQKFIGRYPSLEDLFMDFESDEKEVEAETESIQMTLEDVQELVEELELELLKSDEVNWEQTQKVEETLQKMEDIQEQIEQIQEQMELMNEMAENNQLVSQELQEKFSQLQDLLSEIMTPELLEAMEKLQQAMENMDPEEMLQALQEFEFNAEEFEEQLDRFMEMFQQAMAEQKLDEVVKRLEEMVEEQTEIMEEMSEPDANTNELASRERRQEEGFDHLRDAMEEAAESMEKFAAQPAQELQELADSELTSETGQELEDTRKSLQQQDMQNAMGSGSQSQQNLEEMLNQASSIQQEYQEQTVAEMVNLFQRVVQSILAVSHGQEKLNSEGKLLKSRSPRLVELAVKQGITRSQTNQAIEQLLELSRKSFYISPAINRAMGKGRTNMDKAITQLEQRNISNGKSAQSKAIEGLNEAANLMLAAMDQMQQSGSASGFQSFMESLAEMSGQQEGINNSTMQLGGMSMMNQQGMMQRLQAQQQQLQKALSDLLNENPGEESGGLGKAEKEMEDVIEDFKRRKVDRQTMEQQERILSRMLDAQKSLSQRDYSEKRKSKQGETFTYDGPAGLPSNLGEREILLIEAMEEALQEGHSREYQNIIKTYFRELQKVENQENE